MTAGFKTLQVDGSSAAHGTFDVDYWNQRWADDSIGWYRDHVNYHLEEEVLKLEKSGKKCLKVFIPLCGNQFDLYWLAKRGHEVVGVECSKIGIERFFNQNNLTYTLFKTKAVKGALTYKADTLKLKIIRADIFDLDTAILSERRDFDLIFDRAAMVCIEPSKLTEYCEILQSLLNKGGYMLVEGIERKGGSLPGPPYTLSEPKIEELFKGFDAVHLIAGEKDDEVIPTEVGEITVDVYRVARIIE